MRVAIIDLGTNSVRFDVHQLSPKRGTPPRQLHREKLMVRLGQGVFSDGRLNAEAIRRTLGAFVSFERTARDLHVTRIVAFGTAALREATDGDRLLDQIRSQTGIEIRVISGAEEAKLIALGVLRNEKLPKGKFGLIDIGGGSTEISICQNREMLAGESFPLGTARLQQIFFRSSPPRGLPSSTEDPITHVRRYIRSALLPKMIADEWPKVDRLFGSSGTVRALIRLAHPGKLGKTDEPLPATKKKRKKKQKIPRVLTRTELKKLVREMSRLTTTELLSMPGMEAKRVDMILAGAVLLEECMVATGAKRVEATEFSLRDGILEEQLDLVRQEKASSVGLHLDELKDRAAKLYHPRAHYDEVASLAGKLFDLTRRLHHLPLIWKSYLQAAAILHDLGEVISPSHHEEHSYYIVKNMDPFASENWEVEFMAQLCRWHRAGKPQPWPNFGKNSALKRDAFSKLLALLRITVALDRGHHEPLKLRSLSLRRGAIVLKVGGPSTPDLELLRVEQKKALFEEVFKRDLRVEYQRTSRGRE